MNSKATLIAVVVILLILFGGYKLFKSSQSTIETTSPSSDTTVIPTPIASEEPTSSSESTSAASPGKEEIVIKITATGFSPKTLNIKAGDTVTWMNEDSANHQINSSPHPVHTDYPPLNTIGLLKPGDKKSLTFPAKGVYKFHDHLNPSLFGSITVE